MIQVIVPFKYQDMSGRNVEAKAGDVIPDFKEWPYLIQKAHVELDWVKEVADVVEEKIVPIEVNQAKGRTSKK
jgi:hypothetical protein